MKKIKKAFKGFGDTDWKIESLAAVTILVLVAVGYMVGFGSSPLEVGVGVKGAPQQQAVNTQQTPAPQQQPQQSSPTPQAPVQTPDTDDKAEDTPSAPTEDKEETPAPSGEMSTAEIVKLFNESANKVKTDATKVVKNYEDREVQEDKLVVPSALKSLAPTLMDKFMKDDTDPIEYATKEDIAANYMVPNQTYVSQLTEADVAEATCVDNGTEYEITIKLKDETNPSAGKGVGSVFDVIEASEITDAVTFVEKFDTEYYNCVVKCRIDKASGHTVWANYITPLVLNVTVNMFGTHDASVGLSFEKDYTITY